MVPAQGRGSRKLRTGSEFPGGRPRLREETLASEWQRLQKLLLNSISADSCLVLCDFYTSLSLAFEALWSQSPAYYLPDPQISRMRW